jgi:hypothetical protein
VLSEKKRKKKKRKRKEKKTKARPLQFSCRASTFCSIPHMLEIHVQALWQERAAACLTALKGDR